MELSIVQVELLLKQTVINMKYLIIVLMTIMLSFFVIATVYFSCQNMVLISSIRFQTKHNEFSFVAIPSKGRDYKMMEKQFQIFKDSNPKFKNLTLYRVDIKNYLNVCKWLQYKARPEWYYPYLYPWERD